MIVLLGFMKPYPIVPKSANGLVELVCIFIMSAQAVVILEEQMVLPMVLYQCFVSLIIPRDMLIKEEEKEMEASPFISSLGMVILCSFWI